MKVQFAKPVCAAAMVLMLAGCSGMNNTQQRVLSGAAIGAGVGAVGTAVTGGCVSCGAAIGAGVGAVGGAIVDSQHRHD